MLPQADPYGCFAQNLVCGITRDASAGRILAIYSRSYLFLLCFSYVFIFILHYFSLYVNVNTKKNIHFLNVLLISVFYSVFFSGILFLMTAVWLHPSKRVFILVKVTAAVLFFLSRITTPFLPAIPAFGVFAVIP